MDKPKLAADVQWVGPEDSAYTESGLTHAIYLPPEASSAPVIVMSHGWAGDESVMWIFRQTAPPEAAIVTPQAPLQLSEGGFAWFQYQDKEALIPTPETFAAALSRLQQFLDSLPRLYPIDPDRLILMGFSQGAMMVNAFTLAHPERVRGVVSLAGAVPQVPEPSDSSVSLAGLPVFIAHGTRDETVPLSKAQETRDIYTRLGAEVTYKDYPAAHKMSSQGMKDLAAWLAEHL